MCCADLDAPAEFPGPSDGQVFAELPGESRVSCDLGRLLAATFASGLHAAVNRRLMTGSRLELLRGHGGAKAAGLHARTSP